MKEEYSNGLDFRDIIVQHYYDVFTLEGQKLEGFGSCTDAHIKIPPKYKDFEVTIGTLKSDTVTEITIPANCICYYHSFIDCRALKKLAVKGEGRYYAQGNCIIRSKPKRLIALCPSSMIPTDGSIREIGPRLFCHLSETLEEIIIPEGVEVIGKYAFSGCKKLKKVVLPKSLRIIEEHAFEDCISLETVVMQEGIELICEFAFCNCKSLSRIVLPNSIVELGGWVFSECDFLKEVVLPNQLKYVGRVCFDDCKSLTDLYYDGTRQEWSQVETVKLKSGINLEQLIHFKKDERN